MKSLKTIRPSRKPDFSYEFVHEYGPYSTGEYYDEIWIEENLKCTWSKLEGTDFWTGMSFSYCNFKSEYDKNEKMIADPEEWRRQLQQGAKEAYEQWLRENI